MQKIIFSPQNPNGVKVDLSAEEISQREIDIANSTVKQQEETTAKAQKEADALAGNNKLL